MANLFTSQTPSSTNNSDGTPGIVSAFTPVFAENGVVNGVRIFTTTTVGGTYTGLLYQVTSSDPGTGTLLASKVYDGPTPAGGAWLDIVFDTPVAVTAGTAYRAGVHNSEGRYVATLSFFGSPLTNGDITAPEHNGTAGGFTISQGVFRIDASPGYPNSPGGGGTNYFVDVDFVVPDNTVFPAGLAIPVALGTPTARVQLEAAPGSLAVPVALGAPSSSVSEVLAAPTSLAVPVSLGAPLAAQPTSTPTSLAAPVSLGEPAAAVELATAPASLAAPVSLGEPAIRFVARPAGLAVPVSLGQPTVTRVSNTSGGWSDFAGIIEGARQDAALNAERRRSPVECPEHGWPLQRNSRGVLHCQFGGHIVTPSW